VKRVVVGIDGSEAAGEAARWAAEAVRDTGGEVIVVHGLGGSPELMREAAMSAGRGLGFAPSGSPPPTEDHSIEESWCAPLADAGVPHRTVVSKLDPVQALLGTARDENADLIVIGHRGDTGLLHRLFRGLSDHLLDHAHCPIVVVPYHPEQAKHSGS
jgi:nucleotide-binding universal stress UspA family protein